MSIEKQAVVVEVTVTASIEKVWQYWTEPEHITQWNFASNDWQCPSATNDLRVGGVFSARMEAKDGSSGFDFSGTYTEVVPYERIAYVMAGEDARKVDVTFTDVGHGILVTETFETETENPIDMQRAGWQ
ncbi:MAG: SRPBCC domain-containing protein, partial [Candidatus Doudnabacteria bacterium]|nr:SRPBCC domain-containing protein [Candidatus Doudnabacteria bacterium]